MPPEPAAPQANDRFHGGHRHFPDNIRRALAEAPFLNGGLFSPNDLDRQYDATISDARLEQVLKFLDRYNFTIAEDIRRPQDVPFVWDIAFAEVMESETGGFDIVIGNPPYVRQENIAAPCLPREEMTTQSKREYESKLARSVYEAFPRFFGYSGCRA